MYASCVYWNIGAHKNATTEILYRAKKSNLVLNKVSKNSTLLGINKEKSNAKKFWQRRIEAIVVSFGIFI